MPYRFSHFPACHVDSSITFRQASLEPSYSSPLHYAGSGGQVESFTTKMDYITHYAVWCLCQATLGVRINHGYASLAVDDGSFTRMALFAGFEVRLFVRFCFWRSPASSAPYRYICMEGSGWGEENGCEVESAGIQAWGGGRIETGLEVRSCFFGDIVPSNQTLSRRRTLVHGGPGRKRPGPS